MVKNCNMTKNYLFYNVLKQCETLEKICKIFGKQVSHKIFSKVVTNIDVDQCQFLKSTECKAQEKSVQICKKNCAIIVLIFGIMKILQKNE